LSNQTKSYNPRDDFLEARTAAASKVAGLYLQRGIEHYLLSGDTKSSVRAVADLLMIADMVGPRNKQMRNGTTTFWGGQHVADQTLAAMQEMERYCAAHPGSPAAVRRHGL
jgi:hypothetical protein